MSELVRAGWASKCIFLVQFRRRNLKGEGAKRILEEE
jgi:hypothetical protein